MSEDRYVTVGEWRDIDDAPDVDDRDKQRVATIFNEQEWDHVVWIPEWLLEDSDKDVETVEGSGCLAVGELEDYSDKAWQLWQPHRNDGLNEPSAFLPKSTVVVFDRVRADLEIETPQAGLSQFGGDGR